MLRPLPSPPPGPSCCCWGCCCSAGLRLWPPARKLGFMPGRTPSAPPAALLPPSRASRPPPHAADAAGRDAAARQGAGCLPTCVRARRRRSCRSRRSTRRETSAVPGAGARGLPRTAALEWPVASGAPRRALGLASTGGCPATTLVLLLWGEGSW
ncbi:MAG: hypothetical protein J3K34DRAFT_440410 [Monoraphidium minutum]|nr:MAG: hypothetical protein J3K34DRAFT_440410 [Monoraphidium minutum]